MIDLRLRCVELALEFYRENNCVGTKEIKECADILSSFILGDSELPKSPMNMDRVFYETMLEMVEKNKANDEIIEKLKEKLASDKNE